MKTKVGIPEKILEVIKNYPEIGKDLQGLGFLRDKSWEKEKWPFGIVKSKHHSPVSFKRTTVNKVVQMSCAACHAGKLPDGRVSLGATNEEMHYGRFNIYTLYSIWLADKRKYDETRWLPELIEKYKKLESIYNKGFIKTLKFVLNMPVNDFIIKYLIGEEPPPLVTQRSFLYSSPGIYNGFAPSLNFDDREILLTAPQIYGIGSEKEAHYGSLAGLESLDDFVGEAFIYTTRTSKYNKAKFIEPVKEFLKCLKAPKIQKVKNITLFEKGEQTFKANCLQCHSNKNGGSLLTIAPEEIGTPDSYLGLFKDYKPTDIQSKKTFKVITKLNLHQSVDKIKVRRLSGIWTRNKLTSNGQIQGMNHLFCLDNLNRKSVDHAYSRTQGIHKDLCNDYSKDEKLGLIEYLKFF